MTDNKIKEKLIELGAENLADALLKIAEQNEKAADLLGHIIATPSENIQRFKNKLQSLRTSTRYISWSESRYFAQELEALLDDLRAGVESPKIGIELISEFFETDSTIFEQCDDSSGYVGGVFQTIGTELFGHFANNCNDKSLIINKIIDIYENDNYGVRFCLIESARKFLSKKSIRELIHKFETEANKYKGDSYEKKHWQFGIISLAKQLKDAELYEKVQSQMSPEMSNSTCLDIAKVYLESGNAEKALIWVDKIKSENNYNDSKKDELLFEIYKKLGNDNKMAEIAWILFRKYRNKDTLSQLLEIIGAEKKNGIIKEECAMILKQEGLSLIDAEFLIQMSLIDEAEKYILEHQEELNGYYYGGILHLADGFEKNRKYLAASILYRALLESILERAQSKYYHHGVRYLKKLDELALSVPNWNNLKSHQEYHEYLMLIHHRKYSFWDRYKN